MDGANDGVSETILPGVGKNGTSACTGCDITVLTKNVINTSQTMGALWGAILFIPLISF